MPTSWRPGCTNARRIDGATEIPTFEVFNAGGSIESLEIMSRIAHR